MCVCCSVVSDSSVATRTVALQAPLSMGFSRQEHWRGLPCPPPGNLPGPWIELRSPVLQVDSSPLEPLGKPKNTGVGSLSLLQVIFPTQGLNQGFRGAEVKVSACNVGDLGSIPGSGRSPGEGNGTPLQYSCLGNLTDRGAWGATVHGVSKSWIRLKQCLNFAFIDVIDI